MNLVQVLSFMFSVLGKFSKSFSRLDVFAYLLIGLIVPTLLSYYENVITLSTKDPYFYALILTKTHTEAIADVVNNNYIIPVPGHACDRSVLTLKV